MRPPELVERDDFAVNHGFVGSAVSAFRRQEVHWLDEGGLDLLRGHGRLRLTHGLLHRDWKWVCVARARPVSKLWGARCPRPISVTGVLREGSSSDLMHSATKAAISPHVTGYSVRRISMMSS